MKTTNLVGFKTKAARSRAINKLAKAGYNYFVVYQDDKLHAALQYSKSTSKWVKSRATKGVLISGLE